MAAADPRCRSTADQVVVLIAYQDTLDNVEAVACNPSLWQVALTAAIGEIKLGQEQGMIRDPSIHGTASHFHL
eukprot:14584436-Heterocapsa_arctica.AAC.1